LLRRKDFFSLFFLLWARRGARLPWFDLLVFSSCDSFCFALLRPPDSDLAEIDRRFFLGTRPLCDIPDRETARKPLQHRIPVHRSNSSCPSPRSFRFPCRPVCTSQKPINLLMPSQIVLQRCQLGGPLAYLFFKPVDLPSYRRGQIFGHRVPPKMKVLSS